MKRKHLNRGVEGLTSDIATSGRSGRKTLILAQRKILYGLMMVLLPFTCSVAKAEIYYSMGNVPANELTSWSTIADGGGPSPVSFTGSHTWIIQASHKMNMSDNWIVGENGTAVVIIEGGLTVSSSYLVTITGTLAVNGILTNSGTDNSASAITASSGITINGSYEHAQNGGIIPVATWDVASNCNITGIITTTPTIPPSTQPFGNFTWNCTSQANNIYLHSQLTWVNGNLNIVSTNGNNLLRFGDNLPGDITVNGDFIQSGGRIHITSYAERRMTVNGDFCIEGGAFYITSNNGAGILDVNGDFFLTGGYFSNINYWVVQGTLNVKGNCSITGGTFMMSKSSGTGTLNVAGNFSHTGGTITEESTGSGSIVFNGTSKQTFTSGGLVVDNIDFIVNDGANLQMAAENTQLTGDGSFTLSAGGTLGITSPYGITSSGTVINPGNVAVTGARNYNIGASYIYNGSVAQASGSGLPTDVITGNVIIENNASVTTTNSLIVNGTMIVTGTLIPGTAGQVISGSGKLMGTGTVRVNRTLPIADFSSQYPINEKILTDLTVEYSASSGGQIVSALTYGNLKINNTTGTNTSGGEVIVEGTLTTSAGGTWDIDTNQLTVNNLSHRGAISINSTTPDVDGSMIVKGTIDQGTGTVTYHRQLRSYGDNGEHYFSAPVANNTADNKDVISELWIWDENSGEWIGLNSTFTGFESGKGYRMTQMEGGDDKLSFTGKVKNYATITATSPYLTDVIDNTPEEYNNRRAAGRTVFGGGGINLLGNPFTSALRITDSDEDDANDFLNANFDSFDPNYVAVYLYNSEADQYLYVGKPVTCFEDPSLEKESPVAQTGNGNIPAGQGFFVMAEKNDVLFSFTSNMQTNSNDIPTTKEAKGNDLFSGLKLKLKNGENEYSTTIVYNENMTPGLDPGYDVGYMSIDSDIEIYTTLVSEENYVKFTRQALPVYNCDKNIIPVGIGAEIGGTVTFSASSVPLGNYRFFLEDRKTGIFTDLSKDTYTVTLPSETYGTGQFYLYVAANLPTSIEEQIENPNQLGIQIWATQGRIIIKGPVGYRAFCEVYNIQGSKILETLLPDEAFNTVTIPSTSKGVYVVRVKTGGKVYTKKVVFL